MSDQGHWVGLAVDPRKHFGFIYQIMHVPTGRAYIGRKQIWMAKQRAKGCRSRTPDINSPKWKWDCWKESDWRTYSGSSKSLKKFMKEHNGDEFRHEVIELCGSKGVLSYCEARAQWDRKVLEKKMADGTYEYFNGQIGAIKFRPKLEEDK